MKFSKTKIIFAWLAAFWLLGAVVARAHDPYQGYTDVLLHFQ